jgi:hypothetical protein
MCCGRISYPLKRMNPLLEHKEKLSDLYKDIPIETQCGLLSAHIVTYQQLHVLTCQPTFVNGMTVCKNISLRCMSIVSIIWNNLPAYIYIFTLLCHYSTQGILYFLITLKICCII